MMQFVSFASSKAAKHWWIGERPTPIGLISRETRKRKQSQRYVVCTFRRQEIPVVFPTRFLHERNPKLGVALEHRELIRVDDATEVTSDHAHLAILTGYSMRRKFGLFESDTPPVV
jgi:hypothetical protein